MFERFTTDAREAVRLALSEARDLGAERIGCEHLLIGLARGGGGPAAAALATAGVDTAGLRRLAAAGPPPEPLDADALATLGIDLDEVRRAAEASFGPGALDRPGRPTGRTRTRMTAEARKAIELALRQVRSARSGALTSGHLLIGIIDQADNGALRLLTAAGADLAAIRADTLRRLAAAA